MSYDARKPRGDPPRRSRRDYDDDGRDEADLIPPPPSAAAAPRSALKDPSRDAPRSNSRVRVSDDIAGDTDDSDTGSIVGQYVKHRDGRIEYTPTPGANKRNSARAGAGARPRDLEKKTDPSHRDFRERRDGYGSDEGDALKDARRRSGRRGGGLSDDDGNRVYRDGDTLKQSRRKPKSRGDNDDDDDDDAPPYSRGSGRDGRGYGEDAALAGAGAAAGYAGARAARRGGARGNYDDDYRAPPRSSRRPDDRGYDRGYDSERPRRGGYADDDSLARRRGGGGGSDRYRAPVSRYDDDRRYPDRAPQRSKSDRRPRYDDDDDRRGARGGRAADSGKLDLNSLFQQHAMPIIKREGPRLAMKQLNKFLT